MNLPGFGSDLKPRIGDLIDTPPGRSARGANRWRLAVLVLGLALVMPTLGLSMATLTAPTASAAVDGSWRVRAETGHWYALVFNRSFAEAEAYAVSLGAHLVSIADADEESWLVAEFGEGFAIGYSDLAAEGTWAWSSGEPVTYENWFTVEPNNVGNEPYGEDVAVVEWREPDGRYGWNDIADGVLGSLILESETPPAGGISGTITSGDWTPAPGGYLPPGQPMNRILAVALGQDPGTGEWVYAGQAPSAGDGTYALTGLAPGDYLVMFTCNYDYCDLHEQYWNTATSAVDATPITVPPGEAMTGVDAVMYRLRFAQIVVNPTADWISGGDFISNMALTIDVDGTPIEGVTSDPGGNFWFDSPSDIRPGMTVSVSDGATARSTTVTDLRVSTIDDNVVSGWATADEVRFGVWDSGVRRIAPVAEHLWSIDVSTPGGNPGEDTTTTLGPGSGGNVSEADEDGDETMIDWRIPNPRITVAAGSGWMNGSDFLPDSAVTIEVNGSPLDVGGMTTDQGGSFWFDGLVGVAPGDTVVASDGSSTKTLVVTTLGVTGVTETTVSGHASTAMVNLWVWGTDVGRTASVELDGTFAIDVSIPGDEPHEQSVTTLGPGSGLSVEEHDGDGDATQVGWQIPNPRFTVSTDGWLNGMEFAASAPITITVNAATFDVDGQAADDHGNFWLDLPGIVAGDSVTVSDGVATKDTVVTGLLVTGIVGNEISGWAATDAVSLWVDGTEVNRNEPVVDHLWSIDVSLPGNEDWEQVTTELVNGSRGGIAERDEDGDETMAGWSVPNPRFAANVEGNWIEGQEFAPGAAISITLNGRPIDGGHVTTDETGYFWFDDPIEISAEDSITVSDGTTLKDTVVTHLAFSISGNVVSGTADTDEVSLWVWDSDVSRTTTVASDGSWEIDVSVPGNEDWEQATTELGPGSGLGVGEQDPDGDETRIDRSIPDPGIYADPEGNTIWGRDVPGLVTVTVVDPGTGDSASWSGDQIGYGGGWFWFDVDPQSWNLEAGDEVTVEGQGMTRRLTVADLAITGYDLEANTVWGTTNQAGPLDVNAGRDDDWTWIEASPAGGAWSADFDDAVPPRDLRLLETIEVTQRDDDGDGTFARIPALGPARFVVAPVLQEIVGSDWPDGAVVTLTIDRPSTPASPVYTAASTAGAECMDRDTCPTEWLPVFGVPNVFFNLTLGTFRVEAGDVVTMSDTDTTKSMVVADLVVGPGEPDAMVTDEDGDSTWVAGPQEDVWMDPAADRIWAVDIAPGDVDLTIQPAAGGDPFTMTVASRNVLTRGSWNLDMWVQPTGDLPRPNVALFDLAGLMDLQAGDLVTVDDGVSTMTRTVADLTVDDIDAGTDTITGHSALEVTLHLGEGGGGYWGYAALPDAGGQWSFTFEPGVSPNPDEGLTPGMTGQAIVANTIVRWTVPEGNELTVVTADDQTVDFGAPLPPLSWVASEADVDWTVEPECTTTAAQGSPPGTYPIACTGAVAEGYDVQYVDGTLTIVRAAQVIDFASIADQTLGDPPLALAASASSGLAVTFTSTTPTVCKFVPKKPDKLTLLGAGTCTIVANQAGDANFLPAPPVSQSFTVNLAPISVEADVVITNARDLLKQPTAVGEGYEVRVRVAAVPPAGGTPAGVVSVSDGSATCTIVLAADGTGSCLLTSTSAGVKTITATYHGDSSFDPATTSATHRVKR